MQSRKPSYNQLNADSLAQLPDSTGTYGLSTPMKRAGFSDTRSASRQGGDIDIGDKVDAPGGLYGTVRFIGPVRGKPGVFVGVELDRELSGKGKNDGSVEGTQYFQTAAPNSGIFLPLSKAAKRQSGSHAPQTPTNSRGLQQPPSLAPPRSESPAELPRTPKKGTPGLRTPGRPGASGRESPSRRSVSQAGRSLLTPQTPRSGVAGSRNVVSPSPSGKLNPPRLRNNSINKSMDGGRPGTGGGSRVVSARVPASAMGRAPPSAKQRSFSSMDHSRQFQRGGSDDIPALPPDLVAGLGQRSPTRSEDRERGSPLRSPSRQVNLPPKVDKSVEEIMSLKSQLAEKESQLQEQSNALMEMEGALTELQNLVQDAAQQEINSPNRNSEFDGADAIQLRQMLRDKNEKIQELTAEFDSHREDFRSTIDALELASQETERVYEKRIEELMNEIRDLQERDQEMENVSQQLGQLTEIVNELEEGLEDARRGEAEARSEVEFLRGEVERVREELRRERERNAMAAREPTVDEIEKRDDEIRGLRAIIQSLGSGAALPENQGTESINGEVRVEKEKRERLEREIRELQSLISNKISREEELEKEIKDLRSRKRNHSGSVTSLNSPYSPSGKDRNERESRATIGSWRSRHGANASVTSLKPGAAEVTREPSPLRDLSHQNSTASLNNPGNLSPIPHPHTDSEDDAGAETELDDGPSDEETALWCEICEKSGHDILSCNSMFSSLNPDTSAPMTDEHKMRLAEKKKSVHLPAAPPLPEPTSTHPMPQRNGFDISEKASTDNLKSNNSTLSARGNFDMNSSMQGPVGGKENTEIDEGKWCALCERDGHDSTDCPFDEF